MLKTKTLLSALLGLLISATTLAADEKSIAITIDDLPLDDNTASIADKERYTLAILESLKRHGVVATAFVNEDKLLVKGEIDRHVALLERWLDAGMQLGNHNFGHLGLWQTALPSYQDAVVRGDTITRWLLEKRGAKPVFYRYPFSQSGKTDQEKDLFESFLEQRGYRIAPFTVEHDDYYFSCVYDSAVINGKPADKPAIINAYLTHFDESLPVFETMSNELFNRQIAQILVIHANRLNADSLDKTLSRLRARGYRFVTLEQALQDPAYRQKDRASRQFGPSWLARWARVQGKKLSVYGQPDPAGWNADQHQRYCKS